MTRVSESIKEALNRLSVNAHIELDLLKTAFKEILRHPDAQIRDALIGAFLTSVMNKEPTVDETVALLRTALELDNYSPEHAVRISLPKGKGLVCSVGSGKRGIRSMNVSTPSALVAASLGCFVAKIGSKSTSSITGSADFM